MKRYGRLVLFGFFVWLVPFLASFVIFPLRESARPLFESIMPVVVTASVVLFSVLHFRKGKGDYFKEGLLLGAVWLAISLALDLLLFMEGPMKMSLADYVADIGVTYLILPVVTIGFGYLLRKQSEEPASTGPLAGKT